MKAKVTEAPESIHEVQKGWKNHSESTEHRGRWREQKLTTRGVQVSMWRRQIQRKKGVQEELLSLKGSWEIQKDGGERGAVESVPESEAMALTNLSGYPMFSCPYHCSSL